MDRDIAARMLTTLAHRGPDGSRLWMEGPVGLGHQMLWSTPESRHEVLPLVVMDSNCVLTADARIDNREELSAALGLRLEETLSDSALILAAYERWGEACPEHLLGDFAFAIWDAHRSHLFCARDHIGIKPFYYFRTDTLFAFASEIKALLVLPEVPHRLNEARIADYLTLMVEDKESTLYQNIFRLPPAHTLTLSREKAVMRCYWALDPEREIRLNSDEEYAEAFREHFTEAVRCRLRSAYPVGSFLSGGLDSSSIACVARDLLAAQGKLPLPAFSGVYDDVPQCDERPFIQSVLDQGGFDSHFVHPDRVGPLTDWEGGDWTRTDLPEDEPLWNPQQSVHWLIYQKAKDLGIRVLLDGVGGDDITRGRAYMTELAATGHWPRFWQETSAYAREQGQSHRAVIKRFGIVPLFPHALRIQRRRMLGRTAPWSETNMPLREDFVRRIGYAEHYQELDRIATQPLRSVRQDQCRNLNAGQYSAIALNVLDRSSALFGMEMRLPFLDKRLVEFGVGVPGEQKFKNGRQRVVMRRALNNVLPEKVSCRTRKANLTPSFNHGLLTIDTNLLYSVATQPDAIVSYVDVDRLRRMYDQMRSRSGAVNTFSLWRIALMSLWLDRVHQRAVSSETKT